LFAGRECFSSSRIFPEGKFFVGLFIGQRTFLRQNVSRGINNMASSDGISARNMLSQILGKIGDLSAVIDQQGSFLSGRAYFCILYGYFSY